MMKKIFLAMAVAIVTATAVSAQKDDSDSKITVSIHQTDQEDGYEGSAEQRCGIRFNLPMAGVVKIEVESVEGLPMAGAAIARQGACGQTVVGGILRLPNGESFMEKYDGIPAPSLPTSPVRSPGSSPERTTTFPPSPAICMEDTGSPFTRTVWWHTISEYIRK